MQPFTGSPQSWNTLIASLPMPHLLQTWEWSLVKKNVGWHALPYIWTPSSSAGDGQPVAAAMILTRSLPVKGSSRKMSVLYIPKGPNLAWEDISLREKVLKDLQTFTRRQGAIFIKMDPDISLGTGVPDTTSARENPSGKAIGHELLTRGWIFSNDQIQFRNTVLIDLAQSEDVILAGMKQKARYNINLARRRGVVVRKATLDDLPLLYRMYAETAVRDGFPIRGEEYYQLVWRTFHPPSRSEGLNKPASEPLIAEVEGQPVAAVSVFYFAAQAVYLFGMSSTRHREKMPNSLLQWEAIRRAKELGCETYNLWGAPDAFTDSDPLWGVFRFKEGLGGIVHRTIGAWDYTPSPILYRLYTNLLPRLMDILRFHGRTKTRRLLGV